MFTGKRDTTGQPPLFKRIRLGKAGSSGPYYTLLNVFLFTIIGFFSYYFILFSSEWWQLFDSERVMFNFGIGVVLVFNLLCGGILWLNSVFNRHYPFAFQGVGRIFLFFVLVAGLLFLYNYGICALLLTLFYDATDPHMAKENWMQLALVSLIDLLVVCLVLLNQSARYTINLYREAEYLRHNRSAAELKALQARLNPHFLFNSLNTLLSEIDYDPDQAKVFTTRLAEVYRYVLSVQDKETVSLHEELDFLQSYLYLHQVRIGHGLKFDIRILPEGTTSETLKDRKVLPLALQLLIENILKHNIVSGRRPLEASMVIDTEAHKVTVENEIRLKKNVKSAGVGLKNLSERYHLQTGQDILVEKSEHKFKVQLPLLED